ncbi:MAG: hypothetical protein SOX92_06475 [Candidatus Onthovivens sp.]|jgi:hypothetical protein|nr:hypothetical protein [Candidatus Onthovivens sp.]
MDWLELLNQIFQICIIPLLGVLTTFLVAYINKKKEALKTQVDNTLYHKYIDLLSQTITDCVIATNQTYVDSLKASGTFDIDAQKKAFEDTCNNVLAILSDDAKEYLSVALGDLQAYIANRVEAEVKLNKQ